MATKTKGVTKSTGYGLVQSNPWKQTPAPKKPKASGGPAAAAAALATPPAAAGTASSDSKAIDPFLTPEEQQQWLDRQFNAAQQKVDLDYNLGRQAADTEYGITEAQRNAEKQTATTIDDMIGRGLFQSSIKDGDIADIARTSTLRQDYLKSALSSLSLYTASRKTAIQSALDDQQIQVNTQAVRNAQEIEPTLGTAAPKPAAGTPGGAPAAPAAPSAVPKAVGKPTAQPTTGTALATAPQNGYFAMTSAKPVSLGAGTSTASKGRAIAHLPAVPTAPKAKVR